MNRHRLTCAIAVLLLSACSAVESPDQHAKADDYFVLQQAEAIRSEVAHQVPEQSGLWAAVALPDNWADSHASATNGKWYRFPVSLAAAEEQEWAVLLPRMIMNASVWWDGREIGSGGRMDVPMARNWHRPLYFRVPAPLLSNGKHWLHIYVRAYAHDGGGLGHVYFGTADVLKPLFDKVNFLHITLSMAALLFTVILTMALGTLWILRRQQTEFGWMAISGIFWSIVISNHILKYPPLDYYAWEWLVQSSVGWYAMSFMMVVHRFIQLKRPVLERVVALYFLLTPALVYLFAQEHIVSWFNVIHMGSISLGAYLIQVCYCQYRREKETKALWMGVTVIFLLVVGVHDWWITIQSEQVSSIFVMQFGPPFIMLFIGGWMIFHVSVSLESQDRYGELLEQQIEKVSAELKQAHQKRLELERKQILSDERQRFTRELHDGMGGHLVALKTMITGAEVQSDTVAETLDQALLDMRLVIDAVGDECDDIGMILGMLRSRMEQQLSVSGLDVSWNMMSLPLGCELQNGHSIHLIRIMQEAITNVIRHADASWVDIRASVIQQHGLSMACIEIVDNGKGMSQDIRHGRGMGNMRQRCEMLGGNLTMDSNPVGGTLVQVIFPLSSPDSA